MNQLPNIFQATFSPNSQDRLNAEQMLKQLAKQQGFLINLLKLSLISNVPLPIRQGSALYLKNTIRTDWEKKEGEIIIEEEKNAIKSSIIASIIQSDFNIRKILASALKHILKNDYPHSWNPINECFEWLKRNNVNEMEGALVCIRVLARRYEYKLVDPKRDNRKVVYNMASNLFPFLSELSKKISLTNTSNEQSSRMMTLILKIFWSCVQFDVPPFISHDKNNTFVWMDICNKIITLDLTPLEKVVEKSNLASHPLWIAKKWAMKIISRIFSRWGSKDQIKIPEREFDKQTILEDFNYDDISQEEWNNHIKLREAQVVWSEWWTQTFSNIFFKTLLNELSAITKNVFIAPLFLHYSVTFIIQAVRLATTWSVLKPNMSLFLNNILFPLICFNKEEFEMFNEDPEEFVRLEYDLSEMTRNIRLQSMFLLKDVLTLRSRTFLDEFMKFLNLQLQNYSNNPNQFFLQKEGVLSCLGVLSERLKSLPKYEKQIETMLIKHVFPELNSPIGIVQTKAIWVFTRYYNIAFSKVEIYLEALQLVINALNSNSLPAQVQSAISIKHHLKIEEGAVLIGTIVDKIMEKLIKISQKLELEELVLCLSHIIEEYPEKIVPFSCTLIEQFMHNFFQLFESSKDEVLGSAAGAAMAVLENIVLVIKSLNEANVNDDNIYNKINQLAIQFLIKLLHPETPIEFITEAVAIFTSSTFSTINLDPSCFLVIEPLYKAWKTFLPEIYIDLLPVWDNLISKLPDFFLSNNNYLNYILEMIQSKFNDNKTDEMECGSSCQMIEVLLLNCKGKIDNLIEGFMMLSLNKIAKTESDELKVLLFEILLNSIYYNPVLAVQILLKSNSLSFVLDSFFEFEKQFRSLHQKKLAILSLSSLISLPLDQIPLIAQKVKALILLASSLVQSLNQPNQPNNNANNDQQNNIIEENLDEDDEHSFEDDKDVNIQDNLSLMRDQFDRFDDDEEEFDFNVGDLEDDDDDGYSIIDTIDVPLQFYIQIKSFNERFPQQALLLNNSFTVEEKQLFVSVLQEQEQKLQNNKN